MTHRTTTAFLWLLIAAPLLPAQDRAPEHLLRLTFTQGQKTRWQVTNEFTVKLGTGDAAPVQEWQYELTLLATVEAVAETGATIAYEIERVVASCPDLNLRYDTAEDEDPGEGLDRIAAVVGKRIVVHLDDRGRLKKRRIPKEVARLDRNVDTVFYSFTDMTLPFPPELPETPVAVGSRWQGSSDPLPEHAEKGLAHRSRYELLSVEGGVAQIRHELLVTLADDSEKEKKELYRKTGRIVALDLSRGAFVGEQGEDTVCDGKGTVRPGDGLLMKVKRTAEERKVDDTKRDKREGKN